MNLKKHLEKLVSIIKKLGIKFWKMVDPFKELDNLMDGFTMEEEDLIKKKENL